VRATRGGLPDHIKPGVRILFVGINPGLRSAAVGHHFAGYSNRFWKLLSESGLVPTVLTYKDDGRLPEWGLGLTNVIARPSSGIHLLRPGEYLAGRKCLLAKIRRYRPKVVALLGVTLFRVLCPPSPPRLSRLPRLSQVSRVTPSSLSRLSRSPRLSQVSPVSPISRLGLQPDRLAGAKLFVLPNPSGRNTRYSYEEMLESYRELKRFLG